MVLMSSPLTFRMGAAHSVNCAATSCFSLFKHQLYCKQSILSWLSLMRPYYACACACERLPHQLYEAPPICEPWLGVHCVGGRAMN